jgi:hypothetical protein
MRGLAWRHLNRDVFVSINSYLQTPDVLVQRIQSIVVFEELQRNTTSLGHEGVSNTQEWPGEFTTGQPACALGPTTCPRPLNNKDTPHAHPRGVLSLNGTNPAWPPTTQNHAHPPSPGGRGTGGSHKRKRGSTCPGLPQPACCVTPRLACRLSPRPKARLPCPAPLTFQAGSWGHLVVELAVRVVERLEEGDRKAVHMTARVWRNAVRLATTRLAPRTLDTGLLKEVRVSVLLQRGC